MMILSFQWPSLLCMAIVFLGWLGPVLGADDIETSKVFKVLTKADNMGGECDDILPKVNAMIPEVQKLVDAAVDAIDSILKSPSTSEWTNSNEKGDERARILLLARQIFGADFNAKRSKLHPTKFLKLADQDSINTMTAVKGNFEKIQNYINKGGDSKWRFSCGDTWVKKVNELQTHYDPFSKGTPIIEVYGLNGGINGQTHSDYTWFDQGGPKMFPQANDEDSKTQGEWYYPAVKGWNEKGPCKGVSGASNGPDAQTLATKQIIWFCDKTWKHVEEKKWKADLTQLTGDIPTDGSAHLDNYQSPGATLLHEMTHQLFATNDNFGYDWKIVHKGRDNSKAAVRNADNYNYFAAAAYLSKVEWHSGIARKIGTQEETIHTTPSS